MDNKKCNTKSLSVFLVLISMYTLKGGNGEVIRCIEKERQALLKFKQELVDYYDVLSSWGSEETKRECCKWRGIVCSNMTGHVISLHLNEETFDRRLLLSGNLSNSLVNLHHLNSLDLSSIYFYDGGFPEFIYSLDKLQYLNLHSCYLTGNVPTQLGNLTNLRALDLGYNDGLVIQNLDWLSNLSSLSLFDFTRLSFNESFETTMFQKRMIFSSLKKLYLAQCTFSKDASSVDVYVNSTFPSLSVLDLSGTGLTSSAFHWLFNISTSLVSIDPSSNQLDGPIPDAFGQKFVFLENLDLSDNRFEGGIPKSLWNLTSLKKLDLSHNNLLGPLPEFLSSGELSKLEVLDVSFNSLQSKISESHLSKLHNLKSLGLSHNSLVLNLTPDWTPSFQLDSLKLGCCDIGSRFPTWVLTQSNVSVLDLSCTNISDELPKLFWDSFPRLQSLNLSHNQISGKLPDLSSKPLSLDLSFNEFSDRIPSFHPNTTLLRLSNNKFSGTISFVCKSSFEGLRLLDLSNNQLSGQLPNCCENISLRFLDLSNNSFSGKIPNSLGRELWTLQLGNNNLSGELPSGLNNSRSLSILDVGGNKLAGNIPVWIGTNLASLVILNFRGNNFFGSLPPEICYLKQIQILDLSRNNLSGRIPLHCFENFTNLVQKNSIMTNDESITSFNFHDIIQLSISKVVVQWKGHEYEYSKTLYLLTLIDLSSNRIEGNIPTEIFQMVGLVSLNLSRNHLSGNIDPAIHRMESLETLDLSRNQLSGEIPMGLGTLASLGVLDLSNNNFSGKIPSGTQLQGFNASTYAGNIGLCGPPLPKCPEDGPGPLSGDYRKLDGDDALTIQSFLKEFYMAIVLGFIVGFWGFIGTLILKKSWRYAYFQFLERIKDCLCLEAALCMRRVRYFLFGSFYNPLELFASNFWMHNLDFCFRVERPHIHT